MRPINDVSSANLMMWLELNLVISVKSSGLSTQPCVGWGGGGAHGARGVVADTDRLRSSG